MRGFTPTIEITIDGKPVASAFYSLLVSARVTDEEGQTVDTCSLVFDDANNQIELPRKGAEINIKLGYKETGVIDKGTFKVEKTPIRGSVENGEFLLVEGKAADLRKDAKAEGRKAYENKSFGEIVKAEAKKMGLEATVDSELAAIKFDYKLRFDQSHMDFITRLTDEVGGIAKPAGGKLIIQKRGSGKSASGKTLATITIDKSDCSSWDIDPDGRLQYGRVEAFWTDPKTGKRKTHKEETGLKGPVFTIREAFPDEKRAKKAAAAEKGRLNRGTANGSFTLYGRPEAQAGAPVEATGFRPGANGEWRAKTVEHIYEPGESGGYTSEIKVVAKEDGKKGKNDD